LLMLSSSHFDPIQTSGRENCCDAQTAVIRCDSVPPSA
jgi:hypothetical protein